MHKVLNHGAQPAPLTLPEFGSFIPRMAVSQQRRIEFVLLALIAFFLPLIIALRVSL